MISPTDEQRAPVDCLRRNEQWSDRASLVNMKARDLGPSFLPTTFAVVGETEESEIPRNHAWRFYPSGMEPPVAKN